MNDLEARLRASAGSLPEAPPVPWAARRAVAEALSGAPRAADHRGRFGRRRRRGRIGGALALAALLTGAGLAAGGLLPFERVPDAVHNEVRMATLREIAANEHARLLEGDGTRPGHDCLVLVDADGATVGCHRPEDVPRQGGVAFRTYRLDGSSTVVLHLPKDRAVTSLGVGGRVLPAPAVPLALLDLGPEDRTVVVNTDEGRVVHRFQPGSEAFDMTP